MFNFFKKKPSAPAPAAPEPVAFEEEELEAAPVDDEPPAPPPAPSDEEEPEPLLTFEEWDRLLAEEEAAKALKAADRRSRRPAPRQVEAAAPVPEPVAATRDDEADEAPVPVEPEETHLQALLRRCEADPYDASQAHELARVAYAEKQPELAVAPLVKTAGLLVGSDWNTAAELLTRLLMMKQDTIYSDLMLADMCLNHERFREAEQALQAALRHEPSNRTAQLGMIRVTLAGGRAQEAIEYCHHALASDPNDASSWEHLGDAHAFTSNLAGAAEHWLTAARLFAHQEQIGEAIRVYGQILMVQPDHPSAAEERANLGFTG